MSPVIPCSSGSVTLLTKSSFSQRKDVHIIKCSNVTRRSSKASFSNSKFLLPQSVSLRLLQRSFTDCRTRQHSSSQFLVAVGADIATEDLNVVSQNEQADVPAEVPPAPVTSGSQVKRTRAVRKSEMPPVAKEDLVTGASFTGKVRSIQPFGAFVDFGAFTDGLVHVSKLSEEFVKEVASVVSVGQEVKVRIVDANIETGRISLTMRESDDATALQRQRGSGGGGGDSNKKGDSRRNVPRRGGSWKTSKFIKGQVLNGTVKNTTRSGAYVSLPEGEEGFLPLAEESEGFGNILGSSNLQAGQEVSVRVLRITRGQATLTMKKEEDVAAMNKQLNQGVVHTATNAFVFAFRNNKDISLFLDDQEKIQKSNADDKTSPIESEQVETEPEVSKSSTQVSDSLVDTENIDIEEPVPLVTDEAPATVPEASESSDRGDLDIEVPKPAVSNETPTVTEDSAPATVAEALENSDRENLEIEIPEPVVSDEAPTVTEDSSPANVIEDPVLATVAEASENLDRENLDNLVPEPVVSDETPATVAEDSAPATVVEDPVAATMTKASESASSVSPMLVKQLRDETGAGMMDCKKALTETEGDIIKAQEFLRKKGLSSAEKKSSRITAEGRIGSYIHDNRIGVLIEVNCETDFVARGEIFKQLVDDLAMQVAACPQVQYLATEDVPEEIVCKEREIEMQKEDLLTKPEEMRSRIVEGRIKKRLEELALQEQPFIKNDKMVVKDLVKQTIATIGENIKVKRFFRYNLGEGLQKKNLDFAAEVAAQTTVKEESVVAAMPPPEEKDGTDEIPEKAPPAVAVSASLVKQLREGTGAGMMDCKKALSECSGDLEKAEEYLRKKGLSSADKKSSRLAVEGRISSYIHDSRIGVLLEVNSETDFAARNELFKELVDDLAMQVVACPQVDFVSVDEIPNSVMIKEKELEMQREDLQSKPENIREKIVEGRVSKRFAELALLEQPFIKDDGLLVKDFVKKTVASLGENIRVRRFVKFTLGE